MTFADELREINKEANAVSEKKLAKLEKAINTCVDKISEAIIYAIGIKPTTTAITVALVNSKNVEWKELREGVIAELALEGFDVTLEENILTISWR